MPTPAHGSAARARSDRPRAGIARGLIAALALAPALAAAPARAQAGSGDQPARSQPSSGDEASRDLPAADVLFDRHIEAIGGEQALDEHKNRVLEGTITSEDGEYFALMTLWSSQADVLKRKVESPGQTSYVEYFDGEHAWREHSNGKTSIIIGQTLRDIAQSAEYEILVDYEENFPRRETVGTATVEGEPAHVVQGVSRFGKPTRLYFHRESDLLIAMESRTAEGDQPRPIRMIFEDYVETDGVLYSMKQIQEAPSGMLTIAFDELRTNVEEFPEIEAPESVVRTYQRIRAQQEGGGEPGSGDDGPRPDPALPPDGTGGGNGGGEG